MDHVLKAPWLRYPQPIEEQAAEFILEFDAPTDVTGAILQCSALGVYYAQLNGSKVGDQVLAPGWTNYRKRLQYETYDVLSLIKEGKNVLSIEVAKGWRMHAREKDWIQPGFSQKEIALIACIVLTDAEGKETVIDKKDKWKCRESKTRFANLYDGEVYDPQYRFARPGASDFLQPSELKLPHEILIPRQGEKIKEIEELPAKAILKTPNGETIIDFGQNISGYVRFRIRGGDRAPAILLHAETLDAAGNFYTKNLRSAQQRITFIPDGAEHTYQPKFTWQGFRYVQPLHWPCELRLEDFTAVAVHSDLKRTGHFACSEPDLNRLYENIVWSMRDNYLDVPTDCPQRDERLGWTGDAQVFVRTATYIYDVERFFDKWLADLASEQFADGGIPHVIPRIFWDGDSSCGWADAAVVCPWRMYLTYGNKSILVKQYNSMQGWIDYMRRRTKDGLWVGGGHFGDWLNLDGPEGTSSGGATPHLLLQNAFFAYSTSLFIQAGDVLGLDMAEYEASLDALKTAYQKEFIADGICTVPTQTACALTLYFGLAGADRESIAAQLAGLVRECGHLKTGFLGTPYLLHALSDNGYADLAYDLLLHKDFPGWLYPLSRGATTMWEHWDGLKPDGTMWSDGMNSFNHYAYGAVYDWMFSTMCGIREQADAPGFKHIVFAPISDNRISYAEASLETRQGLVSSRWERQTDGTVLYTFQVPPGTAAEALLAGKLLPLKAGTNTFTA
ncbi:MAG: glycoside hydrolase family 78 protein [Oscillospiraceae bacterium]|jgi:alpha-L-rhamnosidase|nr:glycoside hydrolase family 78 protein [Oscillospiraceae bacterium]